MESLKEENKKENNKNKKMIINQKQKINNTIYDNPLSQENNLINTNKNEIKNEIFFLQQ